MDKKQSELRQQHKNFLIEIYQTAYKINSANMYDAEIEKNKFLETFGLKHSVSYMAYNRYYKAFETFGAVIEVLDANTLKSTGKFKLDKEKFEEIAVILGLKPKAQTA